MGIPRDIRAERGQPILPAWQALLRFIEQTGIVRGPGVRIQTGPWGTRVWADSDFQPWAHPFAVSSGGAGELIVSPGTVNGLFPFVEGGSMAGEDEAGNPVEVPKLQASATPSGTSWVILEVIPGRGGEVVEGADTLRILHEEERPRPGSTKQALAMIRWHPSGSLRSIFQIVHHNLAFGEGGAATGDGEAPRGFFWAV